jgi:hypothetical protein
MKPIFIILITLAWNFQVFAIACTYEHQRPQIHSEYPMLFANGRQLIGSSELEFDSILNPSTTDPSSGIWNLGVLSFMSSGFMDKTLVLKIGSAELFDYEPGSRNSKILAEYVAAHRALGDLKVAPQLHALIKHQDLLNLISSRREIQELISLRYESFDFNEHFNESQRLGIVMEELYGTSPLSRGTRSAPFMAQWCEAHVIKALDQMVEIRRRVITAGIYLEDKQLVVTPTADIYIIDMDAYRFNRDLSERVNFVPEATALISQWEQASGHIFAPELWEKYNNELRTHYSGCTLPVLSPSPDFRLQNDVICEDNSNAVESYSARQVESSDKRDLEHDLYRSNILSLLATIKSLGVQLHSTSSLTTIGIIGAGGLALRYVRALNPIGALVLGLGVSPAAAADICSYYLTSQGFDFFLSLNLQQQYDELLACPELLDLVTEIGDHIRNSSTNE